MQTGYVRPGFAWAIKRRSAFTLVELLVVIAIITVLAGLLMPALSQALELAKATACMGNQHQVALLNFAYQSDYGDFLVNGVNTHSGKEYFWHNWIDGDIYDSGGNPMTPPGIAPDSYYDAGNLGKTTIFRCTKNTGDVANSRNAYGVVYEDGGEDKDFACETMWDPSGPSYFHCFNVGKMKSPSEILYLGCSLARLTSYGAGNGSCKIYLTSLSDAPSNTARGAWLTHLGRCNGLFADGHSVACGPGELMGTRNGYKSEGVHGIRVWKLEDGSWAP
ncbi:MAG: type II secretion system protein [Planctomycetes bacterium]|nr:type II secretion system protein [Planctomycetota bacterium]